MARNSTSRRQDPRDSLGDGSLIGGGSRGQQDVASASSGLLGPQKTARPSSVLIKADGFRWRQTPSIRGNFRLVAFFARHLLHRNGERDRIHESREDEVGDREYAARRPCGFGPTDLGLVSMIQLTAQTRIFVAIAPADFRRGIDGLAKLAREELDCDPFCGALFVFRNRRRTAVKILAYDCRRRLIPARRWRFARMTAAFMVHVNWAPNYQLA